MLINHKLLKNDILLSSINEKYKLKSKIVRKEELLPLTVNDMNDVKFTELNQLISNINFDEELNFEYENKRLVKKYKVK